MNKSKATLDQAERHVQEGEERVARQVVTLDELAQYRNKKEADQANISL